MNWLVIGWFLTLGIVPQQQEAVGSRVSNTLSNRLATVAEVGLTATAADRFVVGFSVENYQYKDPDSIYFNPYRVDYKFNAGVKFNAHVSVWFEHECDHPVEYSNVERYTYSSQESKLYLKFEGTTR
jgi:hypothetical protein